MTAEAGHMFEPIAHGFYLEGLLVDGDNIWFTDVVVGGVQKVGSDQVLLPDRTMIGGLLLNDDGCLLVSGADGIAWVDPDTGRSGTLVNGLDGVNEMRADAQGGMVFGTTDLAAILRGERPGASTIRQLSADRDCKMLADGLTFANGIAVSPDCSTLYFNESFSATRAFPIGEDGSLGEPRTLIEMYDCDGMALDAEGNIWVTGFASDELRCVTPDGTEVRRLALPGKACTNVRFGGPDLRDLYVSVVDPASARQLAQGLPLTERSSAIYRTRSPVAGAPIERTHFAL
ncbi:SMP-30/gluconolactonase/LRE family protein [Sphingomonas sp. LaA6.9]|uniref:SMP-30/gluconolactonase/LRE family protein n=1 Tax=Sphingomonas sp. LaA6.9 TaxID=2919914 RepID=UPI001F4FAEFD|nr:SMP-30/gluconolactonase/LRE family protein [Sphingomonas sp. LaA6.9]MCJ8156569.1 SMP-30/gluconolactonase/LRE family protein [Sphingomonas sp. LaA6.9]